MSRCPCCTNMLFLIGNIKYFFVCPVVQSTAHQQQPHSLRSNTTTAGQQQCFKYQYKKVHTCSSNTMLYFRRFTLFLEKRLLWKLCCWKKKKKNRLSNFKPSLDCVQNPAVFLNLEGLTLCTCQPTKLIIKHKGSTCQFQQGDDPPPPPPACMYCIVIFIHSYFQFMISILVIDVLFSIPNTLSQK